MLTMTFAEGYALWCNPRVTPRYYEAVQRFINHGSYSTGSDCDRNYEAIEKGGCLWSPQAIDHPYVGRLPGRLDVEPGEPGSYEYVVEKMGKEHADAMAALGGFDTVIDYDIPATTKAAQDA